MQISCFPETAKLKAKLYATIETQDTVHLSHKPGIESPWGHTIQKTVLPMK